MEENSVAVPLEQITLEVKFYLNQTAQNIIEVGKRLTQAKAMLPHGDWQNWLKDNFGLSKSTANNFMRCAERFSNFQTSGNLNPSQMVEMLALPAGEEEKFIEQKKNEGTPVEDMTIKSLREQVAKYKADYEAEKAKTENLFAKFEEQKQSFEKANQKLAVYNAELKKDNSDLEKDNDRLKAKFDAADKLANQYHVQRDQLQHQLENQKPLVVEPDDYQQLKKAREQLKNRIAYLEKELENKPIEFVTPADYDATKKELATLQAEHSEIVQSMEVFQKLDTVARLIRDISNSPSDKGIENFAREKNDRFGGMCADFKGFIKAYGALYDKYLEAV